MPDKSLHDFIHAPDPAVKFPPDRTEERRFGKPMNHGIVITLLFEKVLIIRMDKHISDIQNHISDHSSLRSYPLSTNPDIQSHFYSLSSIRFQFFHRQALAHREGILQTQLGIFDHPQRMIWKQIHPGDILLYRQTEY